MMQPERIFACALAFALAPTLLPWAKPVSHAQVAKPATPAKASTPWKFRLEEARIEDIHRAIKTRQITCEKVVQAYINRVRAYDGQCVAPVNPNDANDPKNHFPDSPNTPARRCSRVSCKRQSPIRPHSKPTATSAA